MSEEQIVSGGFAFKSVWLKCSVSGSRKSDEALVRVTAEDVIDPALFFVDADLVEPKDLQSEAGFIDGKVQSILLGVQNGTAIVEIPGEPVSFGPKVFVSKDLLVE